MARDEDTFPKAFVLIKDLYKKGKIRLTKHKRRRSTEREIETPDLDNLIRCGRMVECRYSPLYETQSYTIEGLSVDNEPIGCSVAISDEVLIFITVFRIRRS